MNKQILGILALSVVSCATSAGPITSAADPQLTGSTFVDLEPTGSSANRFTTFSGSGFSITSEIADGLNAYSGYNSYGLTGVGTPGGDFDIIFDTTVSAFSIDAGAVNQDPVVVSLFDEGNNLIESLNFGGSCCSPILYGAFATGIKRVNFDIDYVVLDGLRFVPEEHSSGIPEPAIAALMGLGLAGVGFAGKRKKV